MVERGSRSASSGAVGGRSAPAGAAAVLIAQPAAASGSADSRHEGVSHALAARGCAVWGVLNVTPDSFSDGGKFLEPVAALTWALRMVEAGADVIDVGGESSRPKGKTYGAGAPPVAIDEELARVLPVIELLVGRGIRVSVDTTKAEVARRACRAGASIVNDVSCGWNHELLAAVSEAGAQLVLMHNRGQGECSGSNVVYEDVVSEVRSELLEAVERAQAAGVARQAIWIDPGIGFAKTSAQSLAVLARTDVLVASGLPVLVGPSRKSFIAELAKTPAGEAPGALQRLGGTAAAVAAASMLGARAVRVHDVAEMRQAALLGVQLREARA